MFENKNGALFAHNSVEFPILILRLNIEISNRIIINKMDLP